jgi:hypothetical protein
MKTGLFERREFPAPLSYWLPLPLGEGRGEGPVAHRMLAQQDRKEYSGATPTALHQSRYEAPSELPAARETARQEARPPGAISRFRPRAVFRDHASF